MTSTPHARRTSKKIICNGGFEVGVCLTQQGAMFCVHMCDGSKLLGLACNGQGLEEFTEQPAGRWQDDG
jgi:hypothetical protein